MRMCVCVCQFIYTTEKRKYIRWYVDMKKGRKKRYSVCNYLYMNYMSSCGFIAKPSSGRC